MKTPQSNHWRSMLVFIALQIVLLGLCIEVTYRLAFRHGVASVKPCVCKPAALARQQIRAAVFSAAKECRA